MSEQLAFPGFGADVAPTDRLLFAIFPSAEAAAQADGVAQSLRQALGLAGRPLAVDRLHVTLHHLGDYVGLPNGVVEAARQAAAAVTAAPFEVVFDRAASFASRPGGNPFVLQGEPGGLAELSAFRRDLGEALARVGLGRWAKPQFTPHMTLLYDDKVVEARPVEPVRWTVGEFVLVHSLLGKTRHIPLARRPLNG